MGIFEFPESTGWFRHSIRWAEIRKSFTNTEVRKPIQPPHRPVGMMRSHSETNFTRNPGNSGNPQTPKIAWWFWRFSEFPEITTQLRKDTTSYQAGRDRPSPSVLWGPILDDFAKLSVWRKSPTSSRIWKCVNQNKTPPSKIHRRPSEANFTRNPGNSGNSETPNAPSCFGDFPNSPR